MPTHKTQNSANASLITHHSSLVFLLCLFLAGCAVSAGGYFGTVKPPERQILRFANFGEPRSLDPHKSAGTTEANIAKELFEGLTVYHPKTLEPLPAGALSWESRDVFKTWIFRLRQGCRWSDGRPVTAHDYVYAWRRATNPETACPYVGLMYYIKNGEAVSTGQLSVDQLGVTAVDDYTLRVEMEHPTPFFLKMTAHFLFVPLPSQSIDRFGAQWVKPENMACNGPFRLVKHRANDEIVAVKNEKYWDAANVKLEKVYFLPVNDAPAMNLYKAGEVDAMMAGLIPLPFSQVLKTKRDFCVGPNLATYYYSINVARPPFDNLLVRQALNLAINKAEIAEKLLGRGELPAAVLVPPGLTGYEPPKGPEYDPAKARELLAKAGYPDGKGFRRFTINYNTQEGHRQIAETIQRMWKENLGLSVELQNEEWQTFQARWERRDFDVCRDVWQGDYLDPITFLDCFQSDNPNNHSAWIDPKYAALLQSAALELDPPKRLKILAEAEARLIDQVPIIPIYFYAGNFMKKPYVLGFEANLLDVHQLKFVSIKN